MGRREVWKVVKEAVEEKRSTGRKGWVRNSGQSGNTTEQSAASERASEMKHMTRDGTVNGELERAGLGWCSSGLRRGRFIFFFQLRFEGGEDVRGVQDVRGVERVEGV